jgi:transglutaminase-like putative cysteine protease
MTWRLKIRHVSGYRYQTVVSASYNEARITPLTTDTQLTVESRVDIHPLTRSYRYWDYWGTLVHAFDLHVPHTELVVSGSSVVETATATGAVIEVGWDQLGHASGDFVEYLMPTVYVPLGPELATIAEELRSEAGPADTAHRLSQWVRSAMSYEPGTTKVSTSAVEALNARRGVCQDFAHVFLGLARSLGIPARYVSGYLHPDRHALIGTAAQGQSHAWAEVWAGEWTPVDPTNGEVPGLRHVIVARGRDYRDVAPLKGIYSGGAAHALDVEVELTRIG